MRILLAGLALLAGAAGAQPPAAGTAAESTTLVDALEVAPLGVAGRIEGRSDLGGGRAFRALVRVESVLAGTPPPGPIPIAWEELASSRPARFGDGERVLLALGPLPKTSLWRQRIPDTKALLATYGVSEDGTAFLRSPSLASLTVLRHYLALPAALRPGPDGQRHLLALAADAERALAVSAARRLAAQSGEAALDPATTPLALRALVRADADAELADVLLRWVERRQPAGLAPALDAALTKTEAAPATFVAARGRLGDGIPPERERAFLASASPAQRVAAAEVAGPEQAGRLADLLRGDPEPQVRSAALARLARLEGPAALDALLDAFDDDDAGVRDQAALQVAAFGAEAVPRLRDAATRWTWPAPQTAVLALRLVDAPEAREALTGLAENHPDQRVRTLAELALGRPIGHKD
jgi:HEAT repeat protein